MKPDESQVFSFWLDVSGQHYHASDFCLPNMFCVYSVTFGGISVLHLPNSTSLSVFCRAGWARTKPFLSDKHGNLLPQRCGDICSEMSRGQRRGCDQSPSVWPQTACGAHTLQAGTRQCWPASLRARSVQRRGVRHQSSSDWVWECCDGRWASNEAGFIAEIGVTACCCHLVVLFWHYTLCLAHSHCCAVQQPAAVLPSDITWRHDASRRCRCSSPV